MIHNVQGWTFWCLIQAVFIGVPDVRSVPGSHADAQVSAARAVIEIAFMNCADHDNKQVPDSREMTVVHIREPAEADYVEVVFVESPRFYKLYRNNPDFDQALVRLRQALAAGQSVEIGLTESHGDVIQAIRNRPR